MRLIILGAVSLAIPSSAPATPPASATPQAAGAAKAECIRPGTRMAGRPLGRALPRRLDQLPPGRLYHTVIREVDGCVIPAVVHDGLAR